MMDVGGGGGGGAGGEGGCVETDRQASAILLRSKLEVLQKSRTSLVQNINYQPGIFNAQARLLPLDLCRHSPI